MIKIKFPLLVVAVLFLLLTALCFNDSRAKNYVDVSDAYEEVAGYGDEDSGWPDSIFEVVKNCPYLSDLEKDVVTELNKCRTNPSRYADEVLVPYLHRIGDDGMYVNSRGLNIRTKEGRSVVREAIDALRNQEPLPMLLPDRDLSVAATDHCKDQGPTGLTGHDSSAGIPFSERMKQYDFKFLGIGENIDYGACTGKEIIRSLVVDDGVPSRGHRVNTFGNFNYVGVSFGSHKVYRYMCVLDFALNLTALCVNDSHSKNYVDEPHSYDESAEYGNEDSSWPDSIFEVVKDCSYLSDLEKDVVTELNKCRTNPSRYADEVLVPYIHRIGDDGTYVNSQGLYIMTNEGRSAVQKAIDVLKSQEPLPMLLPDRDLSLAAMDHCKDQGPKGTWGHDGSDGSTVSDRVRRRNPYLNYVGENISYGESTAVDVLRQLIVDDGVPSRDSRENIFRDYKYVGVGFGTHKSYRYMCVLDFALKS